MKQLDSSHALRAIATTASAVAIFALALPWYSLEGSGAEGARYAVMVSGDVSASISAMDDFTWLCAGLLIVWLISGLSTLAVTAGKFTLGVLGVIYLGSGATGVVAGFALTAGVRAPTFGSFASVLVWSPEGGLMVAMGACLALLACGGGLLKEARSKPKLSE